MANSPGSSFFSSLLHFVLSLAPLFFLSTSEQPPSFKDVSLESPVLQFVPTPHARFSCERVRVTGISRLNLKHYANSLHVVLKAPEKLDGKSEVFMHRNASRGLCQFEDDEGVALQKGQWSAVISPYEKRYVDVKIKNQLPGSVTVTVEEEFQPWRLICLGIGLLLLLMAPVCSTWVPFYVCSSMAVGVLAVVLLIAFQLMKLLPMGRKNILYITLYGSVLGVGSYIAQYFSTIVNSILVSFGLSDEMHYPVSVLLAVFIALAGAALGYWLVRKYVISDDGSIDAGVAQFVKWAMRILGVVFVLQSSRDRLLPVITLGLYWCISLLSKKWHRQSRLQLEYPRNGNLWQRSSSKRTEFLTRPYEDYRRSTQKSSNSPYGQYNPNIRAITPTYSSPRQRSAIQQEDYYSSYHKTPGGSGRRFSKSQWEDFTRESTREALAEWAASPEVVSWVADNAHRLRLEPEHNYDDSTESSSDSSEETVVENGSSLSFFNWR